MTPRRNLSEFLCRELLYDYATDSLDPSRKEAVESSLKEFPDLEDELEAIKNGMNYLKELKGVEVSQPLVEYVSQERGVFNKFFDFSGWPKWLKWSLEALVIAVFLGGAVYFIPHGFWSKEKSDWTLAEVEVGKSSEEITLSEEKSEEALVQEKEEELETEVVEIQPPRKNESSTEAKVGKTQEQNPEEGKTPDVKTPVAKIGYVYRMYMFSNQVDKITPMIVEKIKTLGGSKAGEVKLGWRKKQGSYFHFKLGEGKYSEITKYLSEFGSLRVSKDEHKRVMPKGELRFILWIEEINPKPQESDEKKEGFN